MDIKKRLADDDLLKSVQRFRALEHRIQAHMKLVREGHLDRVESPERLKKYASRKLQQLSTAIRGSAVTVRPSELGNERSLGLSKDLLSIEFFEQGLMTARAVGRIVVMDIEFGTGFLVGENLLMTNHHVLRSEQEAAASRLELDYETNRFGSPKATETFSFDPSGFFLTLPELDATLVAVQPQSESGQALAPFGTIPLIVSEGKIRIGDPVNIIQHPDGRPKMVVVHDSCFLHIENGVADSQYCWYSSDTEPGSSGAPVFNNSWEIVALHHKAIMKTNEQGDMLDRDGKVVTREEAISNPNRIYWIANEGVRVSHLVRAIEAATVKPEFEQRRQAIIERWKRAATQGIGAANLEHTAAAARNGVALESGGRAEIRFGDGGGASPRITIHVLFDR